MRYKRYQPAQSVAAELRETHIELARLRQENRLLRAAMTKGMTFNEGMAVAAYMKTHGLTEYAIGMEAIESVTATRPRLESSVNLFKRAYVFTLRETGEST